MSGHWQPIGERHEQLMNSRDRPRPIPSSPRAGTFTGNSERDRVARMQDELQKQDGPAYLH